MGETRVAEVRRRAKEEAEGEIREEMMAMRKQHVEEMGLMRKQDEQFFEEERQNIIEDFEAQLRKLRAKENELRQELETKVDSLRRGPSSEGDQWRAEKEHLQLELKKLK